MHWLYLALAIIAEVLATSALKAAAGFTQAGPAAVVISAYAMAFYFLSLSLDRIPLGVAYAIWSGVGLVLIALIGRFYYRQVLDPAALVGMGLILAGVLVIQLYSKLQDGGGD